MRTTTLGRGSAVEAGGAPCLPSEGVVASVTGRGPPLCGPVPARPAPVRFQRAQFRWNPEGARSTRATSAWEGKNSRGSSSGWRGLLMRVNALLSVRIPSSWSALWKAWMGSSTLSWSPPRPATTTTPRMARRWAPPASHPRRGSGGDSSEGKVRNRNHPIPTDRSTRGRWFRRSWFAWAPASEARRKRSRVIRPPVNRKYSKSATITMARKVLTPTKHPRRDRANPRWRVMLQGASRRSTKGMLARAMAARSKRRPYRNAWRISRGGWDR